MAGHYPAVSSPHSPLGECAVIRFIVAVALSIAPTAHAADPAVGCYRVDDDKKRADGPLELTDKAATGQRWYEPGDLLVNLPSSNPTWTSGSWRRKGDAIFVRLFDNANHGLIVAMHESASGLDGWGSRTPDVEESRHPKQGDVIGADGGTLKFVRQQCVLTK